MLNKSQKVYFKLEILVIRCYQHADSRAFDIVSALVNPVLMRVIFNQKWPLSATKLADLPIAIENYLSHSFACPITCG